VANKKRTNAVNGKKNSVRVATAAQQRFGGTVDREATTAIPRLQAAIAASWR